MSTLLAETASDTPDRPRPLVAVSACLLGHAVRYDGGDKAHALIVERLLPQLEIVPLCPEAGAGLGVPRPPVQLVRFDDGLRARGRDDPHLDVTAALNEFATAQLELLAAMPGLCGHIFKSRSPSCGLASTPIYPRHGAPLQLINLPSANHLGNGLYADKISTQMPWLVFAEETALDTVAACDNFLQQLFFVQSIRAAAEENKLLAVHRRYQRLWQDSFPVFVRNTSLERAATEKNWQAYLVLALSLIANKP